MENMWSLASFWKEKRSSWTWSRMALSVRITPFLFFRVKCTNGIVPYIYCRKSTIHVGGYTNPMDGMGIDVVLFLTLLPNSGLWFVLISKKTLVVRHVSTFCNLNKKAHIWCIMTGIINGVENQSYNIIPLGIQSPKLRMGAWNLNTFLRMWLYTPCSSSEVR